MLMLPALERPGELGLGLPSAASSPPPPQFSFLVAKQRQPSISTYCKQGHRTLWECSVCLARRKLLRAFFTLQP